MKNTGGNFNLLIIINTKILFQSKIKEYFFKIMKKDIKLPD
jgi:hypothetical protein